jgi:hypothetical protein
VDTESAGLKSGKPKPAQGPALRGLAILRFGRQG